MPRLTAEEIRREMEPLLQYYASRDRELIAERVEACILERQKAVLCYSGNIFAKSPLS